MAANATRARVNALQDCPVGGGGACVTRLGVFSLPNHMLTEQLHLLLLQNYIQIVGIIVGMLLFGALVSTAGMTEGSACFKLKKPWRSFIFTCCRTTAVTCCLCSTAVQLSKHCAKVLVSQSFSPEYPHQVIANLA